MKLEIVLWPNRKEGKIGLWEFWKRNKNNLI
jgi:hypothetical protein